MTTPEPAPRYLTRAEAADYLRVSTQWLASTGLHLVPSLKFGHLVRYDVAALDRWAAEQSRAEPLRADA